jgi:hypothetical protein
MYRSEKAGYMTASSTAASNQLPLAKPGVSIHDTTLLEPMDNILPSEAEADYYAQIHEPAMVA